MIEKCDLIVAWITPDNKSGYGTTFELGMAYALNKPYIFINEQSIMDYKWDMQRSGALESFTTKEEAFKWIKDNNRL